MSANGWLYAASRRLLFALLIGIPAVTAGFAWAQQSTIDSAPVGGRESWTMNGFEVLHVQGDVYMISGDGGNIAVQVGENVIVVDSGIESKSKDLLAVIEKLTSKHILFVINTSDDTDHYGGNETLSKAGWALPDAGLNPLRQDTQGALAMGASILAHNNIAARMSETHGKEPPIRSGLQPTDTYDNEDWKIYNGEAVFLNHATAHTDGDTFVLFRKSDVVCAGDIFTLESYPVLREEKGSSINGTIDALNRIIDIMVAMQGEEGGSYVIPGHGHIGDRNDVVNYRDMVTIIRDRIDHLIKKGMTLEQVQAAKPTLDYDPLFAGKSTSWTKENFVEAVYRDLSKSAKSQGKASGGGQ